MAHYQSDHTRNTTRGEEEKTNATNFEKGTKNPP